MAGSGFLVLIVLLIGCLVRHCHGNQDLEIDERNFLREVLRNLVVLEGGIYSDESEAQKWLEQYNEDLRRHKNRYANADWNYLTNITDESSQRLQETEITFNTFAQEQQEEGSRYYQYSSIFRNESLVRQLMLVNVSTTPSPTDPDDMAELADITSQMKTIYATGTLTDSRGKVYHLEPELSEILSKSRNYEKLVWVWTGFRNATGRQMRDLFTRYVELNNKAAQESGVPNMGDAWQLSCYEESDMEDLADHLWAEIRPLYKLLHAYVRYKLNDIYPGHIDFTDGIPAHLLGDMWGQEWQTLASDMMPYPEVPLVDVTAEMKRQNFSAESMFRLAEDYFVTIGLNAMTDTFWEKSMIVKPDGRDVECHGSAEDFYSPGDFRIKMCTEVDSNYLGTVHHEMGHVVYFMQYEPQPTVYRDGANCAFHEAVGDTIALMINTPEHLKKIGLLGDDEDSTSEGTDGMLNKHREINYLMRIAMEKLPLLPFALVVEKWRYGVFRGEINPSNYNQKWWHLRKEYQGLIPPVERTEEDFDPGAKYHIAADVPYLRYFLSFVVQFQFHEQLCEEAGVSEEIHYCDIYGTDAGREAGAAFGRMLSMGRSKPWKEALKSYLGHDQFRARSLLKFFNPLKQWLAQYIMDNDVPVSWD